MTTYVFDTNIFINLQRDYPISVFPSLWQEISSLMECGTIISSAEVYDEIMVGDDSLKVWVKSRKKFFLQSSVSLQEEVRSILSCHRALVESGRRKNTADPFVIALAKQTKSKVVTAEKRSHSMETPKIPDVCDYYQIECINFIEFAKEQQFSF